MEGGVLMTRATTFVLGVIVAVGTMTAQNPGLSGRWKLNGQMSKLGSLDGQRRKCCIDKDTIVDIVQSGQTTTITVTGTNIDYRGKDANRITNSWNLKVGVETVNVNAVEFTILPDGREYYKGDDGQIHPPEKFESYDTASWEGNALAVTSKYERARQRVVVWSVSSDRKRLTEELYFSAEHRNAKTPDAVLVFDALGR